MVIKIIGPLVFYLFIDLLLWILRKQRHSALISTFISVYFWTGIGSRTRLCNMHVGGYFWIALKNVLWWNNDLLIIICMAAIWGLLFTCCTQALITHHLQVFRLYCRFFRHLSNWGEAGLFGNFLVHWLESLWLRGWKVWVEVRIFGYSFDCHVFASALRNSAVKYAWWAWI